jgi:predicted protein tyrosine phosphatase
MVTKKLSNNRRFVATNNLQGSHKKVLCVCSGGVLRSPTAAWVLSRDPYNFNTRAVGTSQDFALIPLDLAQIAWADEIVVFDDMHEATVVDLMHHLVENESRGANPFNYKPIHNFDIEDDFEYRDPILVKVIEHEAAKLWLNGGTNE